MAGRHRASLRPACSTTHQQPRSPGSSLTSYAAVSLVYLADERVDQVSHPPKVRVRRSPWRALGSPMWGGRGASRARPRAREPLVADSIPGDAWTTRRPS